MEMQTIIEKLERKEQLTAKEIQMLIKNIDDGFQRLKEEDPKKYLEFLKNINSAVSDLNQNINKLKNSN